MSSPEAAAVGSEAGLSLGRPLNDSRTRSLLLAGIRDLRFGARGELYIATARDTEPWRSASARAERS